MVGYGEEEIRSKRRKKRDVDAMASLRLH